MLTEHSIQPNHAEAYLLSLQTVLSQNWLDTYQKKELDIYEKLSLLHPDHIDSLDLPYSQKKSEIQSLVQGPRQFKPHHIKQSCDSRKLWGYSCKLDQPLEQDHLFPYSLGGPTISTNRIFLCKYHNMVKSCDIHILPWNDINNWIPLWVDNQLNKLYKEIYSIYS